MPSPSRRRASHDAPGRIESSASNASTSNPSRRPCALASSASARDPKDRVQACTTPAPTTAVVRWSKPMLRPSVVTSMRAPSPARAARPRRRASDARATAVGQFDDRPDLLRRTADRHAGHDRRVAGQADSVLGDVDDIGPGLEEAEHPAQLHADLAGQDRCRPSRYLRQAGLHPAGVRHGRPTTGCGGPGRHRPDERRGVAAEDGGQRHLPGVLRALEAPGRFVEHLSQHAAAVDVAPQVSCDVDGGHRELRRAGAPEPFERLAEDVARRSQAVERVG